MRQLLPCIPAGWVPQNPWSVLHIHAGTRTAMGQRNFGTKIALAVAGDAGSEGRRGLMSERVKITPTDKILTRTATD